MADSTPADASLAQNEAAKVPADILGESSAAAAGDEALPPAASAEAKKKKTKKSEAKHADAVVGSAGSSSGMSQGGIGDGLTPQMARQLLTMNPQLRAEFAGMEEGKALEKLRRMEMADLMAGLMLNGKTAKDMDAYKFWSTQPVPRFDEKIKDWKPDGVIQEIKIEEVSKQPRQLMDGFEWVVVDLDSEKELTEVHELLSFHYVEDDDEMFRLNYASSFLNWALKSPGWKKEWHVGVRASKSQKLVAFISAVPCKLQVRENLVDSAEVNFLVVHKKLRGKRLAPVMIEEITRQCYLQGVFQACYTAGTVIPKPVSSCRYYHRSLQWQKLYECKFAGLPTGSTVARQVAKNKIADKTQLKGLRPMAPKDVPAVTDLLGRYLKGFVMAPEFSEAEVMHWMVHDPNVKEQVIWSYVVEEPGTNKITDFVSFYLLESTVIGNTQHSSIKAAYLFYYATEAAFSDNKEILKTRLNELAADTLVLAKKVSFEATVIKNTVDHRRLVSML